MNFLGIIFLFIIGIIVFSLIVGWLIELRDTIKYGKSPKKVKIDLDYLRNHRTQDLLNEHGGGGMRLNLDRIEQFSIVVNGINKKQGIYRGKPFFGIGYILEDDELSGEVEFDKYGMWIEQRAYEKGKLISALCLLNGNMDKIYTKDFINETVAYRCRRNNIIKTVSFKDFKTSVLI